MLERPSPEKSKGGGGAGCLEMASTCMSSGLPSAPLGGPFPISLTT